MTSNCINPAYVRTPLVEKQIADQARIHGIPEDEVVEKIMLTETRDQATRRGRRGRLARRLARLRQGRHGHGRLVHDGRRMDGAMSDAPIAPWTFRSRAATLRVGVWDRRRAADAPDVLLVHGVTASHLSWPFVVERLPGVRVDRARPARPRRSNDARRARRAGRARARPRRRARRARRRRAVVVGHSMGAFVALVFGDLHPERVSRLVLVDGGLPLDVPAGLDADEVVRLVLGPDRRAPVDAVRVGRGRTSTSGGSIRRSARDWSPSSRRTSRTTSSATAPRAAPGDELRRRRGGHDRPEHRHRARRRARRGCGIRPCCSRAERGLLDQVPALYSPERLPGLLAAYPRRAARAPSPDVNHYTIVLSERGADAVAAVVRGAARSSTPADGRSLRRRADRYAREASSGGRPSLLRGARPRPPGRSAPGGRDAGRELVRVGEEGAAELGQPVGPEPELDAGQAQRPLRVALRVNTAAPRP